MTKALADAIAQHLRSMEAFQWEGAPDLDPRPLLQQAETFIRRHEPTAEFEREWRKRYPGPEFATIKEIGKAMWDAAIISARLSPAPTGLTEERIARAIARGGCGNDPSVPAWVDANWTNYLDEARAVIAEIGGAAPTGLAAGFAALAEKAALIGWEDGDWRNLAAWVVNHRTALTRALTSAQEAENRALERDVALDRAYCNGAHAAFVAYGKGDEAFKRFEEEIERRNRERPAAIRALKHTEEKVTARGIKGD